MASDGESLIGLWFDGQKHFAAGLQGDCEERDLPIFMRTRDWLDCYFAGMEPDFTPSIQPAGTPFRMAVWEELLKIPYGKTTTYGGIAKEMALQKGTETMSAQAVGGAVGHNPISIIIPCHRVVGSGGGMTGYAGGTDKKEELLRLEGAKL